MVQDQEEGAKGSGHNLSKYRCYIEQAGEVGGQGSHESTVQDHRTQDGTTAYSQREITRVWRILARRLQRHREGPPGQEENEIINCMWKVLVVICTLGNPCTLFGEDPVKWYKTEAECLKAADVKAIGMVKTFKDFGYHIDSEAHSCLYVAQNNEA